MFVLPFVMPFCVVELGVSLKNEDMENKLFDTVAKFVDPFDFPWIPYQSAQLCPFDL